MRCRVKPLSAPSLAKRKACFAYDSVCVVVSHKCCSSTRSRQSLPTVWTGPICGANHGLPELPAHSTLSSTIGCCLTGPRALSRSACRNGCHASETMCRSYALRFALLCFHVSFVVKLHRRVDEILIFSSPLLSIDSICVPGVGV